MVDRNARDLGEDDEENEMKTLRTFPNGNVDDVSTVIWVVEDFPDQLGTYGTSWTRIRTMRFCLLRFSNHSTTEVHQISIDRIKNGCNIAYSNSRSNRSAFKVCRV